MNLPNIHLAFFANSLKVLFVQRVDKRSHRSVWPFVLQTISGCPVTVHRNVM